MQRLLVLPVVLALALSGCVSTDPPAGDGGTGGPGPGPMAPLPDAIEDTRQVQGGVDIFNVIPGTNPCSQQTDACTRYPFTLAGNASMSAQLTWTNQGSDFDLYLNRGGEQVGASTGGVPQTGESITAPLTAGDYEVVVVAWAVVQDTYTLRVTFAPPAANATAPR